MKMIKNKFALNISLLVSLLAVLYSCANVGRPTGGPVDETPPRFLRSTPSVNGLNVQKKKIVLEFDEIVKLEKLNEKVVVSPPQIAQPKIKAMGRRITVNLEDSLIPNTTYTIDFSDAIVDNNEGNPLGNYSFSFSTGANIDTMSVSGHVLEASNLEPVKGMLVGLHSDLADSAFTSKPFIRLGRTDSRGFFEIKGIAPGKYKVYALKDADQNYMFNQKSEALAFLDSIIVPSQEIKTRQDTIWQDTLTIDTIYNRDYTHYLPDDIILRSFTEELTNQYLIKSERLVPEKFSLFFATKADSLPNLKGLNFDEKDAFIVEKHLKNDTIHYWIKDSLIYKKDTLSFTLQYLYTDSLNQLVPRKDTINLALKKKKVAKKKKKKKDDDKPVPTVFLKVDSKIPSSMDVYGSIELEFEKPLAKFDKKAIHLMHKVDSTWENIDYKWEKDSLKIRKYTFYTDWKPKQEYKFIVDSLACADYYGLFTDKIEQSFKVKSLEDYGAIYFNISNADSSAYVELLDEQDKVIRKVKVKNNKADFYYLAPAKYSARLVNDKNNNNVWDTGIYEQNVQPEEVYYYPQILDLKALWELEQDWNVKAVSLDKQKVDKLKKQKPDEKKKKKQNTNQSRRVNRGFSF